MTLGPVDFRALEFTGNSTAGVLSDEEFTAAKAKVYARIVMTPLNAKLLLKALQDNLAKYEEKFGEIRMPADAGFEAQERGIGFRH